MTMTGEQLTSLSGLVQQFQRPLASVRRALERHEIKPALWLDQTPFYDESAVERIAKVLEKSPTSEVRR